MTTALVTGAAGFVGRHLCAHLLSLGWSVDAVDSIHPLTGAIDPNDGWPLFEPRDYREFRFVREDCRDFFKRSSGARYDYVFHLAALLADGCSWNASRSRSSRILPSTQISGAGHNAPDRARSSSSAQARSIRSSTKRRIAMFS
jgi:NAD(P)-dependent dehydrogenase (short-subunit alcohol dehydrogenase family)